MDMINCCRCCLLRPPDKDLKTPYIHFGITEIYADMIKECFELQLVIDNNECGICEVCVGRLRDASDFKLQVQRSQAELQAQLEIAVEFKDEPSVKAEMSDSYMSEEDKQDLQFALNEATADSPKLELTPAPGGARNELAMVTSGSVEWLRNGKAHMCVISHVTSVQEAGLSTHMRAHAEHATDTQLETRVNDNTFSLLVKKENYICDICRKQFAKKSNIIKHMTKHMAEQTDASAIGSKHLYHRDNLSQQTFTHTGQNWHVCDVCQHQFISKLGLISHMRIHAERKPHACQVCNKIFKDGNTLSQHKRYHKGIFKCEICDKHLTSKAELRLHKKIHVTERPYHCDICGKQFKEKPQRNAHKLIHTREKPHTCEFCNKQFRSISALKNHKSTHTKDKPYRCKFCNKRYSLMAGLNIHKQIHTGKLYCCEICGKQFMCNFRFKIHIRHHKGEKPFTCDICQKKFTCKSDLIRHIRRHMKLKSYSCKICAKKYLNPSSLNRHKLIHTGDKAFSCQICSKQFRYKDKLQNHKLIHTGEKPHCCEVCGKKFASKSNFKTHLQIHVKGKTFTCELCPKFYSTKEGLRQHRRVHTGKKAPQKTVKRVNTK